VAAGLEIWSFGAASGAQAQLLGFAAGDGIATVEAMLFGERLTFPILNTGAHWGPNSLCVLLMLAALDVELQVGLEALSTFRPIEGRGAEKTVRISGGAFTLIDESYNANPLSMTAAFKSLGARKANGRRIVALTDMLELGAGSAEFHAGLALGLETAQVDLVFCAGPMMKSLWDALPQNRRGGYAMTAAELAPMVASAVGPGDLVMVKGSNGSKAAAIAAALAQLDAGEV
jgi:UDP-N-acetylmuramoyl-tripeptide--D-alanyl-D-alanine ligase